MKLKEDSEIRSGLYQHEGKPDIIVHGTIWNMPDNFLKPATLLVYQQEGQLYAVSKKMYQENVSTGYKFVGSLKLDTSDDPGYDEDSFQPVMRSIERTTGIQDEVTLEETVEFLNELVRDDPAMMKRLVQARVECNDEIKEHASVQVNEEGEVGVLGLLNGLFGANDCGYGAIYAEFDEDMGNVLTGFVIDKHMGEDE